MRTRRTEPERTPHAASPQRAADTERDNGFTLPELIVVIAILGILVAAASLAVSGISTEASETGCAADRRQLHVAAEAYLATAGGGVIPATGVGHDAHERTLVVNGFLRNVSVEHDLDLDGNTVPESGSSC